LTEIGTIPLATCAKLLKLTARRVNQLEQSGVIPKASRGRYVTVAVVHAYIDYLRDENRRSTQSAGTIRVQDARAKSLEMRIAREEGKTCDIEDMLGFLDAMIGRFRQDLAGLPARFTRNLPERDRLRVEIDAMLEGLSAFYLRESVKLGAPA
jgi:phage terminase Nu1 subunit (DNA packaging protein)